MTTLRESKTHSRRRVLIDVLTSRAFIVGVIVFALYAPIPAALGFHIENYEITALAFAVIAWALVRGRHRVLGFVYFSFLTIGVLAMLGAAFATTS